MSKDLSETYFRAVNFLWIVAIGGALIAALFYFQGFTHEKENRCVVGPTMKCSEVIFDNLISFSLESKISHPVYNITGNAGGTKLTCESPNLEPGESTACTFIPSNPVKISENIVISYYKDIENDEKIVIQGIIEAYRKK